MHSRNLLLKPFGAAIKILVLSVCILETSATVGHSFAQANKDKRIKELESERNRLGKLADPAERAESLMKIARITLTYVNDAITAKDTAKLTSSIEEYRRALTGARDTMMESGLDPYKKPKGYQVIELATRAHLRILEDFLGRLALEERQPVQEVIELASKTRDEIILVLFP